MDADKPGGRRHIVLPAAPDHRVALAHQKAIARLQTADRTVKIREYRGIAPIDDVQEQPLVPTLECYRLEDADICRVMHQAMGIPWGTLQISDPGVAGMMRVDRAVHSAVQLLIGSYVTKSFPLRKGATGLDL